MKRERELKKLHQEEEKELLELGAWKCTAVNTCNICSSVKHATVNTGGMEMHCSEPKGAVKCCTY